MRAPSRVRATGLSLTSGVLFASSGPLAKGVMSAGWSPAAVTSVRIALAAGLMAPAVAALHPGALRFRRGDLWPLLLMRQPRPPGRGHGVGVGSGQQPTR